MKKVYFLMLLCTFALACQPKQSQNGENDTTLTNDTPSNSAIIEEKTVFDQTEEEIIEDDMNFMPPIEEQSYYGIEVGKPIKDYKLHAGILKTGEGEFPVHYMLHKGDTLGYVFGKDSIETIHIWDNRGVTHEGVRVGTPFSQIKELWPQPKVHGSELESRVYVFHKKHLYRLDYHRMEYEFDHLEIPDSAVVTEIIIK